MLEKNGAARARDTSADGYRNRIEAFALMHFAPLWQFIQSVDLLEKWANDKIINRAVKRARSRPSPFGSMAKRGDPHNSMAGYTSWELMTDHSWFKRHLPQSTLGQPGDPRGPLPPLGELAELFQRKPGHEPAANKSSLLLASFAEWFTDGFLMTDPSDPRKTHTSHHIDLNQIYGLTRPESDAVRVKSEQIGQKGRLKTEICPKTGEAFAPFYFDESGEPKVEFKDLRPPARLAEYLQIVGPKRTAEIKRSIFAFAGERSNTTPYTSMFNTLFLREHNRLASLIEVAHPDWDDERVFQTARNVNIVLLVKIVVEEYVNHLAPYHFQLSADPSVAWHKPWNKPNWIPIEFNLLYRWHSMIPGNLEVGDASVPVEQFVFDNSHLTKIGLGAAMQSASSQRATRIGLTNTPDFLLHVEIASIAQGRKHRLASYNDYREAMGYGRVQKHEQITGDPEKIRLLKKHYGDDVEKIEFFVGLFAEDVGPKGAVPPLIGRMVALDAFSQALTNPLLSEHAFNPRTFSDVGWEQIMTTKNISQMLHRNLDGDTNEYQITMELPQLR